MPKIDTITTADGSKRYLFTIDIGRDPTTGKRRQRRHTYDRMKTARAELARLTGDVHAGTYTERSAQTLAEALDMYLASACYGLAEATKVSYANALLPAPHGLGEARHPARREREVPEDHAGARRAALDVVADLAERLAPA